jgi:hypothetical protein
MAALVRLGWSRAIICSLARQASSPTCPVFEWLDEGCRVWRLRFGEVPFVRCLLFGEASQRYVMLDGPGEGLVMFGAFELL